MIRMWLVILLALLIGACTNTEVVEKKSTYVPTEDVKLVAPKLVQLESFFRDSTYISFFQAFADSKIKYKLDNSEFKDYKEPFVISKSLRLSYFCAHKDFINSDTITDDFYNVVKFREFNIQGSKPSDPYTNGGLSTLNNKVKASSDFKDKEWIAFKDNSVELELTEIGNVSEESTIVLSFYNMQSSWIFKPRKVIVETVAVRGNIVSKQQEIIESENVSADGFFYSRINVDGSRFVYKIKIEQLDSLPSWHPGSGGQPWLFMDEIMMF